MRKKVVVFDLDDTLYKEIDFLKSGYRKVADYVGRQINVPTNDIYYNLLFWYGKNGNAFEKLNEYYGINNPINEYLDIYRYHHPTITLSDETKDTLSKLKEEGFILGIITDGREITQKQKVEALELGKWIPLEMVVINEDKKYFKPNHWSFDKMMLKCFEKGVEADATFYYVGDNTEKDFLAPNQLGWDTVCLENNGNNIHQQSFDLADAYLPKHIIKSIVELLDVIR